MELGCADRYDPAHMLIVSRIARFCNGFSRRFLPDFRVDFPLGAEYNDSVRKCGDSPSRIHRAAPSAESEAYE